MLAKTVACLVVALAAASGGGRAALAAAPPSTLRPYAGEAELMAALASWRERAGDLRRERRAAGQGEPLLALQAAPAAPAKAADATANAAGAAESITNVQVAGVDEGGIVKRAGDHLVILRRGRLFTVRVGGDALQPVASIDAYAPGSDPAGAWYDELLVAGSTAVVVGYSYARGGTEIGLFDLGPDGALAHRATYHLRSFDYYSSRNYASRLIGRKLVFYTPTLLQPWGPHPATLMPALRPWRGDAAAAGFERILPATRVFRTDDDFDPREPLALHTVSACELDALPLRCESTAVLGPAGRVFHVAQGAVYVWTTSGHRPFAPAPLTGEAASAVFRIPLDGAAPTGLKTAGVPIDQMSFLEDADGHLNVLLREAGSGEGMWGSERTRGAMALLRVPLGAFGDGRGAAQPEHYRRLPGPAGHAVHNRFVGDWLLWGGAGGAAHAYEGARDRPPRESAPAWALRFAGRGEPVALDPGHGVERIEAMGRHAVLVGNAGSDLHFSSVRLGEAAAHVVDRHVQPGARQGETRSHGFFHHATGSDEGLLGLPVLGPHRNGRFGVFRGGQGAASVLYLRQRELAFEVVGRLEAEPASALDDSCKASCVDWYGNARPIFLGARVFALLGYEIVEARWTGDVGRARIDERRRISFAPGAPSRHGVYSPFN